MTASPHDGANRPTASVTPLVSAEARDREVDPAPNPHATAEQVEAARSDTKLAQVLYHDWEAETYDDKWSISYDERCIDYARGRFDQAVSGDATARAALPYGRALELGCGTGFFLLNLMQAGIADKGSVTDLSPGMVKVALRNAEHLGLDVDGRVADAETIPYDDDTFDLVVGHAVLHHIPDVEQSLREVLRVLKPGGRFVFAGEPTTVGNFYARWLGRITWEATTRATKLPFLADWRKPQEELDESSRAAALEAVVDLHTFDPTDLENIALSAGAEAVQANTEEFAAALLGWPVRTFEAAVPAGKLGWNWAKFAFNGWKTLSWVDEKVLQHVVPRGMFYNVMITGTKPAPRA
ncbi:methyltransferase domain-containing protein [Rhodococcus fascians]|uniref:class I SAM-dependent methyltransferase n=1 Tax=Rhodococcoides fascians TaxID=1828 RepID=UPI001427AE7A|nr:class I SAM-dependent methyltransferase [Rhodococcus fascians]MDP9636939.1 ubiquinone/menaquinone biosynthesis C-methylase UbiE [Rhodococcus cercidiphylli]MBY4012185.1 methyltransferase domain-containing protein [Rhodococcus fascians]MBY4023197.1 methyltransferase domain-containing protein [Rhodococcus fascians]MDJ0410886.1 class I SAM-dependent methyltransferase [Rhodococcus fascians]NIL89919.1 Ubiquinone/menaquinone biosynthesis C-methyltransferase UbiE [Rhodococcus fascians]